MRPLALAVAIVMSSGAFAAPAPGASSPNVLIVISDDQPVDSEIATPQLYDWFGDGTR